MATALPALLAASARLDTRTFLDGAGVFIREGEGALDAADGVEIFLNDTEGRLYTWRKTRTLLGPSCRLDST